MVCLWTWLAMVPAVTIPRYLKHSQKLEFFTKRQTRSLQRFQSPLPKRIPFLSQADFKSAHILSLSLFVFLSFLHARRKVIAAELYRVEVVFTENFSHQEVLQVFAANRSFGTPVCARTVRQPADGLSTSAAGGVVSRGRRHTGGLGTRTTRMCEVEAAGECRRSGTFPLVPRCPGTAPGPRKT